MLDKARCGLGFLHAGKGRVRLCCGASGTCVLNRVVRCSLGAMCCAVLALCIGVVPSNAAWGAPPDTQEQQTSQEQDASTEADEAQEPSALNTEGNTINDGQVSDNSFLYDAAIADLAGADSYYDKQTVQVRGEAVGEAIRLTGGEEGFSWVTLRDGDSGSSMSVVMANSDVQKIDMFGAYGKTGSRLRVQGVYNLACEEHEGESDIHAAVVAVEEAGFAHPDRFVARDFAPGAIAVVMGLFLMALFFYARERAR